MHAPFPQGDLSNRPSYDRRPIYFSGLLFAGGTVGTYRQVTTNARPADGIDCRIRKRWPLLYREVQIWYFRIDIPGSQGPRWVNCMLINHARQV